MQIERRNAAPLWAALLELRSWLFPELVHDDNAGETYLLLGPYEISKTPLS